MFQHLNNYLFSSCNISHIKKIDYKNELVIFPNPAKTEITFQLTKAWLNKNISIDIINAEGKTLSSEKIKYSQQKVIPVINTNSDYYILKISSKEKTIIAKFLLN